MAFYGLPAFYMDERTPPGKHLQLKSLGLIQQTVIKLGLGARCKEATLISSFMTPVFRERGKHSVNSTRLKKAHKKSSGG